MARPNGRAAMSFDAAISNAGKTAEEELSMTGISPDLGKSSTGATQGEDGIGLEDPK